MVIENDTIAIRELLFPVEGIIPEKVVCKDIRFSYEKDTDGTVSKEPVAVRYICINPKTFDTFSIKVPGRNPVIDIDEFRKSDDFIMLEIPVKETKLKPYQINYGRARVSITAPFVKLAKN